jgi:hypothetical protein
MRFLRPHRTERYGIGEGNREPRKERGRTDRVRKRLRRRSVDGVDSVKSVRSSQEPMNQESPATPRERLAGESQTLKYSKTQEESDG